MSSNKKVAYISVYRDKTGYAHSAENFIECLNTHPNIDVYPIWISLTGDPKDTTETIKELEKKLLPEKFDVIIQQTLPEYFCKIEGTKCIGLFFWETTSFRGSGWQYSCNIMDEIWVTSKEQKQACINSGVKVPVQEVTQPFNIEILEKEYPKLEINEIKDRYIFYTISDISYRKNIPAIINCYYNSFSFRDDVALVIKGYFPSLSPKESVAKFNDFIDKELKPGTRKGNQTFWPPIIFIPDFLSEDNIRRLHSLGDCYITMSRGEGVCIPATEAGIMKKQVIAPNWNGPRKTFDGTRQFMINHLFEKPVFGAVNSLPNLYNSDETWFEPSILEAGKYMKLAYEYRNSSMSSDINEECSNMIKANVNYKKVSEELYKLL